MHPRTRIGIIEAKKEEINWAATLVGNSSADDAPTVLGSVLPSDDGAYIAVAGYGNKLAMVDVAAGKPLWDPQKPWDEASLYCAAFSPDSKAIYVGGTSGAIRALDVQTGKEFGKWWASPTGKEEYGHRISCIAVSADGKWFAEGTGPQGLVFVGSTAESKLVATLNHGGSTIKLVQFSPDSKALATFGDGKVKTWKTSRWDGQKKKADEKKGTNP
jgi:WD40 repeat protein